VEKTAVHHKRIGAVQKILRNIVKLIDEFALGGEELKSLVQFMLGTPRELGAATKVLLVSSVS
jgi:hypothetical protein